jgi:hypothetical protein
MADIYSKAERVIIWLGTESEASELAFDLLRKIDANAEVDRDTTTFEEREGCSPQWADRTATLAFDDKEFEAVLTLQNRPWFSRLWVWQEIFLASRAVFMCGNNLLSCNIFWAALFIFCVKPLPSSVSSRDLHGKTSKIRPTFIDLLDQTKHSRCTDARDRVFALLSLAQECQSRVLIEPDYTKSASDIYREFAVNHIRLTGSLNILKSVEFQAHHTDMPSWVPDWSTLRLSTSLTTQDAGSRSS